MALFSEWLKVDSYATWASIIVALSKANEHYLASKRQENLIITILPVDSYQGECNDETCILNASLCNLGSHSQHDTLPETGNDDTRKDDKPNDVKTKKDTAESSNLTQQSHITIQSPTQTSKKIIGMSSRDEVAVNSQNKQEDITFTFDHHQVVELIKEKNNSNIQKENVVTALMNACKNGHYQIVKLLLKVLPNHNVQDQKGWSALMFASKDGHYQFAELLLKQNVNHNLQTQEGGTALIYASHNGHYQ